MEDAVEDFEGKLGQGFMSADILEEVDIGPGDRPRPTFVSSKLYHEFKQALIKLLKRVCGLFCLGIL